MTVKELKAALEGLPDSYKLEFPLEFKVEKKTVIVIVEGVRVRKELKELEEKGRKTIEDIKKLLEIRRLNK